MHGVLKTYCKRPGANKACSGSLLCLWLSQGTLKEGTGFPGPKASPLAIPKSPRKGKYACT